MKPNLNDILICAEKEGASATLRLVLDLMDELESRRTRESGFLVKGHLSETSSEVARVLMLRYTEILGMDVKGELGEP